MENIYRNPPDFTTTKPQILQTLPVNVEKRVLRRANNELFFLDRKKFEA